MKLKLYLSKLIFLLLLAGCKSFGHLPPGCSSIDPSWNEPLAKDLSKQLNEIEILSNNKATLELISKARRTYWYKKSKNEYLVCLPGNKNGCGEFLFPLRKIDNTFLMTELTEVTVC